MTLFEHVYECFYRLNKYLDISYENNKMNIKLNMLKVNNKDNRTTSMTSFRLSLLLTLNIFKVACVVDLKSVFTD